MVKRERLINGKIIFSFVIVVLLVVVVAILLAMLNKPVVYNDDYFVSDDTKIVIPIEANSELFIEEGEENEEEEVSLPIEKSYMVYYYSGNNINDVKAFYKVKSDVDAKEIYESIKIDGFDWVEKKSLSDKYIILQMKHDEFKGLTTETVRLLE